MTLDRIDAERYLRDAERDQAELLAEARADAHRRVVIEHAALRIANAARAAAAEAEDPLPAWFPTLRDRLEREALEQAHANADAAVDLMAEQAALNFEVLRREALGIAMH